MKPSKKDLKFLKKEKKKSEDYKKGFLDGYSKAIKNYQKAKKVGEKNIKEIREIISKLKNI